MLVMETIAKIRRAYFQLGKPIKEICRELRVSRKVECDRVSVRAFPPAPAADRAMAERLDALLDENERRPPRQRLTIIRIYEDLVALGYAGSYAAVRRYARRWGERHTSATAEAFIPLTFAPGEAYQFDWSHEIVVIDGVTTTVKVAHVWLCMSRMMFVRAYPRETQEMVFDAHERAFAFFRAPASAGFGRKARSRTRSGWCASGSSRRGCASAPMTS